MTNAISPCLGSQAEKRCLTWCVQPCLPVNTLHCSAVLEVVAEVALEIISGERLELEVLQIGLQEGLKLGRTPHQALQSMQSVEAGLKHVNAGTGYMELLELSDRPVLL